MRAAVFLPNLVPYHEARWCAGSAEFSECNVVEITNRDEFSVLEVGDSSRWASFRRHTLFPGNQKRSKGRDVERAVTRWLRDHQPGIVFLSGWSFVFSIAVLKWAVCHGVPAVICSESNEFDESRSPWKEFLKKRIVSLCSAGLAGGAPQADYLVKLGLPREHVFVGYDVVDNGFFAEKSKELAAQSLEPSEVMRPYFLACARFGKKKNIPGLIRSYARYRGIAKLSTLDSRPSTLLDLVIVGEGEERTLIEQTIHDCGVADYVHLVGAKGYMELPFYYAHAFAFIHASTTEQWGLVVNEAMASGLPVLVSNRCGCIADLVREGENGWTFDPSDEEQITELMVKISSDEEVRRKMGARSREIIAEWGPERFASGVRSAVEAALRLPRKRAGFFDRMILCFLSMR
jgi:glycosyltransferase involved in cell wall biosynthesis